MTTHKRFSLCIPNHPQLAREALSRRVIERNNDRIAIESKEEFKKKLGNKSPDFADAFVMGLWYLSVELRVREKRR